MIDSKYSFNGETYMIAPEAAIQIRIGEAADEAIQRVALELVRASIEDLRTRQPGTHQAVHAFRKRCKSMRGMLRLVRNRLGEQFLVENASFRDLSRQLSFVRDSQALLEAMDRLATPADLGLAEHGKTDPGGPNGLLGANATQDISMATATTIANAFPAVRSVLTRDRDEAAGGEDALLAQMDAMGLILEDVLSRITDWQIVDRGFDTFADGLRSNYRRARRSMKQVTKDPSPHNFHEWRKRVKYHWHHALFLQPICGRLLSSHRRLAESLGELLGEYQDYSVLSHRLQSISGPATLKAERVALDRVIHQRQLEMRGQLLKLGGYLQAERPKQLLARWRGYWNTWKADKAG